MPPVNRMFVKDSDHQEEVNHGTPIFSTKGFMDWYCESGCFQYFSLLYWIVKADTV